MNKFIRWFFWNAVYLLYCPRTFETYLTSRMRCCWPWRKFKPCVYQNHDGKMWHIWLDEERCVTKSRQSLKVDLHISKSGRVVGFNVRDEDLEASSQKGPPK